MKSKLLKTLLVMSMLLSCMYTPCFGASQLRKIAVIEPGIGIGDITLGNNLQDVIKKMAIKPSDGKTVRSGNLKEYWLGYTGMGITFIFDEEQKLTRIAVSNPGIIVRQKGVRVNSSIKELMGSYGPAEISKISDKYEQWSYKDRGIVFTINIGTWKIETITIEKIQYKK